MDEKTLKKERKKGLRVGKIIFSALFLWFTFHTIRISIDGTSDFTGHADVAVVLGNKVNQNGTLSDRLKARVDAAMKLFKDGKVSYIVVTGGVGKEGHDEALKMKAYLIQQSVPEDVIIVDSQGNTTQLSAFNFQQINKERKFGSVVVVSQFYHITRTKLIFGKYVKNCAIYAQAPDYYEWKDLYALVREFVGYYWYWVMY